MWADIHPACPVMKKSFEMTDELQNRVPPGYCTGEKEKRCMSSNGRWHKSNPGEEINGGATVDRAAASSHASAEKAAYDPLWTPEQVAVRLNVSPDWVRDHSSRKEPRLPVIRLGGGPGRAGLLRYRASEIEKFIEQMENLSRGHSRRI